MEKMTSPRTERRRSVTSSGRSPTSTIISSTSGWLFAIEAAMACRIMVLPAFGADTMRPRWPLPIGAIRSMIRAVSDGSPSSSRRRWSGYSGVRSSKCGRDRASSGGIPFTVSTPARGRYLARPPAEARAVPSMWSPLRSPYWRIWPADT